ncbi:MAG: amidase, partial [Vicinamibacterales bacterium]|nr:amidase [Vicinamibacterales bacterium]
VQHWLRQSTSDVEARGLPEVGPLLEALAVSLAHLREADWNLAADSPAATPPPTREPATPAGASSEADSRASRAAAPSAAPGAPAAAVSVRAMAHRLRAGEISATELLQETLATIDRHQPALNAFITVTRELAARAARAADARLARGESDSLLLGLPVSLKDLIDVAGVPTTAASRVRAGLVASSDATVTARLKAAGAVIVGKCNLHEFAFGTTNEDSAWGPARHPLDPARSPGGSSGGSAVAVATGGSLVSIGTDTGGSIRIPSAACGLVGVKPTWGGVPTDGVVPLAGSLDHVGPLARSVDYAAIAFDVLRGYPHTTTDPVGHDVSPGSLRLGVPRRYFFDLLEDEVRAAFETSLVQLRDAGVTLEEVDIPHAPLTAPVYLATVLGEAAAYHAQTLERRPGDYTGPVRLRLEMCRYLPAEDYLRAQEGRRVLRAEVEGALRGRHALLLPALAIVAPPLGQARVRVGEAAESVRSITLRLTQLFNLTG